MDFLNHSGMGYIWFSIRFSSFLFAVYSNFTVETVRGCMNLNKYKSQRCRGEQQGGKLLRLLSSVQEFGLRPSAINTYPIVILDSLCVLGVQSLGSLVCTPVYPSMWTGYSSVSTDTSTLPRWRPSVLKYLYASHKFYLINKSDQNSSFPLIATNFSLIQKTVSRR